MNLVTPRVHEIAARLIARGETIAVAEGSAGGLISASLLAVPGASAYFLGGAVIYTATARAALLGLTAADLVNMRPATEPYALLLAQRVREKHDAVWGLAETGAAGPSGNRYGDPAGHTCIAIAGPRGIAATLRTQSSDRQSNMKAFTLRAFELLDKVIEG